MKKILFNPNRLKAERIARNLSQEELAIKLGKNRTWLAKREWHELNQAVDERLKQKADQLTLDDSDLVAISDKLKRFI